MRKYVRQLHESVPQLGLLGQKVRRPQRPHRHILILLPPNPSQL